MSRLVGAGNWDLCRARDQVHYLLPRPNLLLGVPNFSETPCGSITVVFTCDIWWQLFAFDKVKGFLNSIERKPGFLAAMPVSPIAGSCAGISSTLVMYPLELLKTRLTIQVRKHCHHCQGGGYYLHHYRTVNGPL